MEEELERKEVAWKEGELYLLIPQRQPLQLNTSGPGDQGKGGLPADSLDQPQGHPGHQESKGQGKGKAPIGSSEGKSKEDPLEQISQPSDLPALDKLLREFSWDMFPEDLA
jgi:hypothetical protein